jgi:hypothetical protein
MDFVEGLPKVAGKSVILTVVDRLSNYAHFIPLGHPYTAESVARVFFGEIVRLHGLPESIVSDRDPVFTSVFWQALFKASGSKLLLSSAFVTNFNQAIDQSFPNPSSPLSAEQNRRDIFLLLPISLPLLVTTYLFVSVVSICFTILYHGLMHCLWPDGMPVTAS